MNGVKNGENTQSSEQDQKKLIRGGEEAVKGSVATSAQNNEQTPIKGVKSLTLDDEVLESPGWQTVASRKHRPGKSQETPPQQQLQQPQQQQQQQPQAAQQQQQNKSHTQAQPQQQSPRAKSAQIAIPSKREEPSVGNVGLMMGFWVMGDTNC